MSSNLLGAPIGPEIAIRGHALRFDHIPQLWELLPNGGWPGVTYAQACVHNVAYAAAREERPSHMRPIRGTEYYEITGPVGTAQMALVGCGAPISGASPSGGARLFFTDGEVERLTGHAVGEYVIWFRPQEDSDAEKQIPQAADGAGRGPQGPERVQARQPAQRKQPGTDSQEP